jgi:hypothetical protein
MGAVNTNRFTVDELARELAVNRGRVHDEADKLGLPYLTRDGVDKHGNPIVRRVYLRKPILAALDEMGRNSQRVAS